MKKVYWIIGLTCLAAVAIIAIITKLYIPEISIPGSIREIETFFIFQNKTSTLPSPDLIHNYKNSYSTIILIDNNLVEFRAYQFDNRKISKRSFRQLKSMKTGHVNIKSFSIDLPGYSYLSVWVNQEQIYIWQKREWIIIMKSKNAESVSKLRESFNMFFK